MKNAVLFRSTLTVPTHERMKNASSKQSRIFRHYFNGCVIIKVWFGFQCLHLRGFNTEILTRRRIKGRTSCGHRSAMLSRTYCYCWLAPLMNNSLNRSARVHVRLFLKKHDDVTKIKSAKHNQSKQFPITATVWMYNICQAHCTSSLVPL